LPEESPVAVPVPAPLSVRVVPLPVAAGLTVPEIVYVGIGFAVKLTPDIFPPLTVTVWFTGVNV
jgi:hypothetical protein